VARFTAGDRQIDLVRAVVQDTGYHHSLRFSLFFRRHTRQRITTPRKHPVSFHRAPWQRGSIPADPAGIFIYPAESQSGTAKMDDPEKVCIAFECEAPGMWQCCDVHFATIKIEIGEAGKDYVADTAFDSSISLHAGKHTFEVQRPLYGYEIYGFASELQKLYDTLDGSVRLYDWDGEVLLCFTVVHRGRGQILVGGRFVPIVLDTKVSSEEEFVSDVCVNLVGLVVAFEGLTFDQSYLKTPLSVLHRFISDYRTECETAPFCPLRARGDTSE
jgi:hypothetical protein